MAQHQQSFGGSRSPVGFLCLGWGVIELGVPMPLDSLENIKLFNKCSNIAEMKFKII